MPSSDANQSKEMVLEENVKSSVECFLISCRSRQLSRSTITLYRLELGYFCNYLNALGVEEFSVLTPETIRGYLVELSNRRNPGGCQVSFRVIKTFLRWTWEEFDFDSRCPIDRVNAPRVNNQPLPGIGLDEIRSMLAACKGPQAARDKAILISLLDTGCRATEFVSLNIGDVNLFSGSVTILLGKGGKGRTTFLGKTARKELRRYLQKRSGLSSNSPLWTTNEGDRLTRSGLRQILRRRSQDAGLPEPGAHDFRRACALSLLRNGADVVSVSRILGHSALNVTMRYLAQNVDDLAASHQLYSPADRLK